MVQAGLREPEARAGPVEQPWWLAALGLLGEFEQQVSVPTTVVAYQMGDAVLQVAVDDRTLLRRFQELYGDCAVPAPVAPDAPGVRCSVRRRLEPPLVVLTFETGAPSDPAGSAYSLLRPTCAEPPFRAYNSPLPGWRLAGGVNEPLLAGCGSHVLIHPRQVPPDFVVEYLVGITLATQRDVLPVHGASLRIGDAGLILVGASRSGKTTTALHLAARGHALLGDEIAMIRLTTGEILPFRRTVNVRPGPYGRELAAALGVLDDGHTGQGSPMDGGDGGWTGPRRISEAFPGHAVRPAPLRVVFFLNGFASRPSLEPFRLTLDREDVISWVTTPEIAYCSWGLEPAQRAFRLLVLRRTLTRIPCWLLTLGPPCETTALIERTMEESQC
jgi:hypothetical protein